MAIGHTWDRSAYGALEQNGTKDMMGNVWEWNEAIPYMSYDMGGYYADRGIRGGSFRNGSDILHAGGRYYPYYLPTYEFGVIGFRVVAVPEPSSIVALLGGLVGLLGIRRRSRAMANK